MKIILYFWLLNFLGTVGGYDNGVQMVHHTIPERKSTSIHRHEASAQNSDRNNNDARNAKINRTSPKPGYEIIMFIIVSLF